MHENTLILYFGTIGMAGMAFAITFFAFVYQKKINTKKQELQQINGLLKATELEATMRFLEGQTKEKNRIAAELHDNIGSKLAILKLQLNDKAAKIKIPTLSEAIDHVLADVRQISHDMAVGMYVGYNLKEMLDSYLKGIEESTQITISTSFYQLEKLHQDMLGKYLFNIIQELLHNTLKYARASHINIEINYFPFDYVNLIYQDNGIGFNPGSTHTGIGLSNIQRRVETYNGQYFINSQPGKGMEANIEFPLT